MTYEKMEITKIFDLGIIPYRIDSEDGWIFASKNGIVDDVFQSSGYPVSNGGKNSLHLYIYSSIWIYAYDARKDSRVDETYGICQYTECTSMTGRVELVQNCKSKLESMSLLYSVV